MTPDELAEVRVEGRAAWALREDVDAMLATAPTRGAVRFLPGFDTYVMGSYPRDNVVRDPFTFTADDIPAATSGSSLAARCAADDPRVDPRSNRPAALRL